MINIINLPYLQFLRLSVDKSKRIEKAMFTLKKARSLDYVGLFGGHGKKF